MLKAYGFAGCAELEDPAFWLDPDYWQEPAKPAVPAAGQEVRVLEDCRAHCAEHTCVYAHVPTVHSEGSSFIRLSHSKPDTTMPPPIATISEVCPSKCTGIDILGPFQSTAGHTRM